MVGHYPAKHKVCCLILGQGTCLGCGFSPQSGCRTRGNLSILLSHTDVSLPSPLSLSKKSPSPLFTPLAVVLPLWPDFFTGAQGCPHLLTISPFQRSVAVPPQSLSSLKLCGTGLSRLRIKPCLILLN